MKNFLFLLGILILFTDTVCSQIQPGGFPDFTPFQLSDATLDYDDGIDPMQSRLFRTTSTREQISLSGFWEFIADPNEKGDDEKYFESWPGRSFRAMPTAVARARTNSPSHPC